MSGKHTLLIAMGLAMGAAAAPAWATFHDWSIDEVYSSSDGSMQFIEMQGLGDGEYFFATGFFPPSPGHLKVGSNDFTFPHDLDIVAAGHNTGGYKLLLATSNFESITGIAPDYVLPNNFLPLSSGTLRFTDNTDTAYSTFAYTSLPGGDQSLNRAYPSPTIVSGTATPTNFRQQSASVPEPAAGLVLLTLTGGAALTRRRCDRPEKGEGL